MFSLARRVGGFPLTGLALALGIWVHSGSSALAQGSGAGYGGPGSGGYGLGSGDFGLGYPYARGHGIGCGHSFCYVVSQLSLREWCSDVLGREDLYPYVADPYSDPAACLGYPWPYRAPTLNAATLAARGRSLGIDEEPVVDAGGVRGMKVAQVYPGTTAAKAGIQVGDVLHSINGYLTQERGNLAWIIAHGAPNKVLTMKVRSVRDGQVHTVTAPVF